MEGNANKYSIIVCVVNKETKWLWIGHKYNYNVNQIDECHWIEIGSSHGLFVDISMYIYKKCGGE